MRSEEEFDEFCKGLEHLSTHGGGRFFIRNMKVFRKCYSRLQRENSVVVGDLASVIRNTDDGLFIGLKRSFSEEVPDHLYRYMAGKWMLDAIKNQALSFGNVDGYDEDDTEVEDYADLCRRVFSKERNKRFIKLARKKLFRFGRVEREVSGKLDRSRDFVSDFREYARACCFTERWDSPHHWEVYADGWSGACMCFDTTILDGDGFKMRPYRMSYEERTDLDLLGQFCELLHVDRSGRKMLDRNVTSETEVRRFCNNSMGGMIERMFTRTKRDAEKDDEWRYVTVGMIDGRSYSKDERWSCPIPGRIKYVIIGPGCDCRDELEETCESKGIPFVEMDWTLRIVRNPYGVKLDRLIIQQSLMTTNLFRMFERIVQHRSFLFASSLQYFRFFVSNNLEWRSLMRVIVSSFGEQCFLSLFSSPFLSSFL